MATALKTRTTAAPNGPTLKADDGHNYGIDLLRLFSQFLVVTLHVMGQGGVLYTTGNLKTYWTAWTIETTAYCAVDIFAMISGYVGYRSKPKPSRIINLWFQTIFWFIPLGFFDIHMTPDITPREKFFKICFAFLPLSHGRNWYLTAYFVMCFFLPLLNCIIQNCPRFVLKWTLLVSLFFITCNLNNLLKDYYVLKGGYCWAWLSIMYLVGGYLGKYDVLSSVKKRIWLLLYAAMTAITVYSRYIILKITPKLKDVPAFDCIILKYISPTIILAGISMIGIFTQIKPKGIVKTLVKLFSPCALGVFIIHTHEYIMAKHVKLASNYVDHENPVKMALQTYAIVLFILVACLILDFLRMQLFRLCGVPKFTGAIDRWVYRKADAAKEKAAAKEAERKAAEASDGSEDKEKNKHKKKSK